MKILMNLNFSWNRTIWCLCKTRILCMHTELYEPIISRKCHWEVKKKITWKIISIYFFREFGIKADAEKYSQYVDFVYDILNTTHANLANLEKYQHIENFENANFLSIAREMSSLIPLMGLNYQRVMTEVIDFFIIK